ncbi:glycosyltransferase family 4 protein [Desulfarculus baarsii]
MRICLDIRALTPRPTGVGNYILGLLEGFKRVAPTQEICLLARLDNLTCLPGLPNGKLIRAAFAHESHPLGDAWEHLFLPRRLKKDGVDLMHGPAMLAPFDGRGLAVVATVHDLVPFTHPETVPPKYASYMRWHLGRLARSRAWFIAPSQATADELQEILNVDPARVTVVAEAARAAFRVIDDRQALEAARYRLGLDGPFVLYVGNIEPRKNLARLIPAFLRAADQVLPQCKLVITGQRAWLAQRLKSQLGAALDDKRLVFTGYVPDDELPLLMNLALAFAFPTLHEGFGLPALEALACGAPLLAGAVGAVPEVVGQAAVLVDPHSDEAIAQGLARLMQDESLRRQLAQAGPERAARFSWDQAARQTLDVYHRACREEA